MSSLRDIVRRHVERETLKYFLGDRYQETPEEEKRKLLDKLRRKSQIDREVNQVISSYLSELKKDTDEPLREKKRKAGYAVINVTMTTLIGLAVNSSSHLYLLLLTVTMIMIHLAFIFLVD